MYIKLQNGLKISKCNKIIMKYFFIYSKKIKMKKFNAFLHIIIVYTLLYIYTQRVLIKDFYYIQNYTQRKDSI